VEAVARLAQESALYSPSLLFEYAVRKDRVLETDRRCVSAALNEAQFLPDGVRVFLNAHPQSLAHGAFASAMGDMIAQAGLDPRQVVFEVTEQHAIGDADAFAARLEPLRARGFGVALDDYGEGVANLHLLLALKPDFLKLSGHFVRGIEEDAARRAVVAATVGLASRLDVPVIAEGVETEGQLRVVSGLGIPYVQGFCFGQPAPAADLLQNEAVTFEATPACPSRAAG
jgi:EAL domain-containing protein (putative c-di-GMP-specific phosphodiesterase class I)